MADSEGVYVDNKLDKLVGDRTPGMYKSDTYLDFYNQFYASTGTNTPREIDAVVSDVMKQYGFDEKFDGAVTYILKFLPPHFLQGNFIDNVDLRPLFKAYEGFESGNKLKGTNTYVNYTINKDTFEDKITNKFKEIYQREYPTDDTKVDTETNTSSGWSPSAKTTFGGNQPPSALDTPGTPLDNGDVSNNEDNYAYNYKEYLDTYLGTSIQDLMQLQDTANPAIPSGDTKSFSKSSFDELTGIVTVKSYTPDMQGKYEEYTDSRIAAETNTIMGAETEVKYNLRQAIQYTSTLNDKQLRELQQMLKVNGYYQNKENSQFIFGENDELTRTAWNRFLTDVLRSEMSPAEFAKKNADKLKQRLESGEFVTEYSDSLMESMADQWGTQMLGRKLNASETKGLALAVRQWDIQNTKDSFYNNPNDGSTVEDDVYSYLMEEYEVEQNQNNMSDTFASMKRVLG